MLSQALQVVLQGWPSEVEEETLKPYFIRKEELCVLAGFLLRGARVIVRPSRERRGVEHITRYSPRNSQNEEFSQELCLVAQKRQI